MRGYGFTSRWAATLNVLTEETIKSSAIEGVTLDPENVRSSLARRLRLDVGGLKTYRDRYVDGVVEMMLDATRKFSKPLTKERLFGWHAHIFPGVRTTSDKFRVGAWRDDSQGPMQVVSGPIGRHKFHYEAPAADRAESEMEKFLAWFEGNEQEDPLLKTAIAHLWFVTIHPFEDGNGRIGRAIAEMCLARSDGSAQRFYGMSSQILEQRKDYYEVLEKTQTGSLDFTEWLTWFLGCLDRAIEFRFRDDGFLLQLLRGFYHRRVSSEPRLHSASAAFFFSFCSSPFSAKVCSRNSACILYTSTMIAFVVLTDRYA